MQEVNWLINICFTLIMLWLFVWDFKTFGEPTHKDFKAIIMSTGVLGTFVGVFVGLMGFDTLALQDSVPLLLEGLKTAFYTSILGMGLAIVLSIIQRAKGVKSAQDMNIDYLLLQAKNLSYLKGIEALNQKVLNLPSAADIKSANNATNKLLEEGLYKIDNSLQLAIKQLALGASKELIGALELVIRDFNQNLQDQFGENFKELNNAVGRLLIWQENYKQSIEDTQGLLIQTQKTLSESATAMERTQATLESTIAEKRSAMEFYNKTLMLIEDMQLKGDVLEAKLNEVATLGEHAQECLGNMDRFFTQASQSLSSLQEEGSKQVHTLKDNMDLYLKHLDSHIGENIQSFKAFLSQSSTMAQDNINTLFDTYMSNFNAQCNQFAQRGSAFFEQIANNASTHLTHLSTLLEENITQNRESSTENAAEFARLREHIAKNHTAIVQSLESSLSYLSSHNEVIMQDMTKDMKSLQEHYFSLIHTNMDSVLQKEQDMLKSRLETLSELALKSDGFAKSQYEHISGFLKKLGSEYLKIMQKLTKDSIGIPKEMSQEVIKDFGDLQHNLISHLGNLNTQIQHNSMQLIELYRNVRNIINENVEGNKSLQKEIKSTFETLDTQMSANMENFRENYEWFLRRVREMIGSRQ